jgi:DNA polymerase-1
VAAGSEAVNLLIGRGAIDRHRGYRIKREGKTYVATNNPALVLRDDSTFPNLQKDFRRAFNPIPPPVLPRIEVIEDAEQACTWLQDKDRSTLISADIESRGGLTHKASLVSIQFAEHGGNATVFGERQGLFTDGNFLHHLRRFLERSDILFIWHNGKFDIKILRTSYSIQAIVDEDTMLMSYACDERTGKTEKQFGGIHKLEILLAEEFGWPNYEPKSVKEFKKTGIVQDYDEFHTYAGRDVAGTYQLYDLLARRIEDEGTGKMYKRLLIEGSEALARIEMAGFRYDIDAAADLMEEEIKPELEQKVKRMRQIIDEPLYNPRSTKQTSILFYDTWKIKHEMRSRPDKNRSTDEAALNEIAAGRFHVSSQMVFEVAVIKKFAKELKRFRELSKQADTYITGLIERAIDDPDGRIYTDLLLHGTTSGRLSSRNPNLQNITRTKPGLPDIRRLFLPSTGRVIVQSDYSQAELRCIAQFSQDKELLRIYNEDLDLHSVAASRFYGESFTSEQRSRAKNMNFGVAYGQGAATFQEKHEIPEREAQEFIDWWWTYFKGVSRWKQEVIKEMRTGRVASPYGRQRRFHLLTKENFNASVREAVNFVPQSTGGDLTLRSVILLAREIDWKKAAIVLTVHDNIIGDVKENYVDEYKTVCEQIMVTRAKDELGWEIPFKIELGVGPSWGEAK